MKEITFAIVGIGNIGTKYAKLLSCFDGIKLVAAVDIDFNKRKSIPNLIPFFTSLADFFEAKIPVDVVCICSPNGLHAEQTIACLENGHHVVCEKPVALTTQDVIRMMEAEKIANKKVFAVMQNRYSPVAIWLKKLMVKKQLGDILFLQVNCFWNRNQKYYDDALWRGTKLLGGGPLYTQFSHFIDLMIWLSGEPYNISSDLFTLNKSLKTEFEDSGVIDFNLENGGKGILSFTNAAYQTNVESSITIIGTKGNVKVGGQYMEKLEFVNTEENFEMPVFDQLSRANQYQFYSGSADKHDDFLKAVIHAIKNETAPEIGLSDELKVIRFISQSLDAVNAKLVKTKTNLDIY
jgi:UDP-N-acetyl-2-amino-2-deoxyglucuronate dehydrogenase